MLAQGFQKHTGYGPVKYCKDLQGRVTVEGHAMSMQKPNNNSLLFTLQPGFRPDFSQEFLCTGSDGFAKIKIQADGKVLLIQRPNETDTKQGISLNGISFLSKT
jgi:hypothetical protein